MMNGNIHEQEEERLRRLGRPWPMSPFDPAQKLNEIAFIVDPYQQIENINKLIEKIRKRFSEKEKYKITKEVIEEFIFDSKITTIDAWADFNAFIIKKLGGFD